MTPDQSLAELARVAGIHPHFTDMQGVVRVTGPDTQRALLKASGISAATPAEAHEALAGLQAAEAARVAPADVIMVADTPGRLNVSRPVAWALFLEEAERETHQSGQTDGPLDLPALPPGVHLLHLEVAGATQKVNVIAAPPLTPSLQDKMGRDRCWGCMASLYSLRSQAGKMLGDYDDLAHLAQLLGRQGADFVGINPVHALGHAATTTISPYSPTHRAYLNTDHISLSDVIGPDSAVSGDLIDYAAHRRIQHAALQRRFDTFRSSADLEAQADFAAFCHIGGRPLTDFATFEALSTVHGSDWRCWPACAKDYSAVGEGVAADAVAYHKWLQWTAARQLGAAHHAAQDAGMALGLYLDLAVGARAGGAESWGAGSAAAEGVTLGAPPDHLSPAGQNWDLAALSPRKLQVQRYRAFRHVLRQTMQHCGVLRIDHALGLSRSYWIPEDGSPGGYVRQPFEVLIALIAIEAARAGTVIIGEDLGLVPEGFREEIAARGLYGYSVMQYEKDALGHLSDPKNLRAQSLACFATHDTPTLAGYWAGRDIKWWEKLGWITRKEAAKASDVRMTEKRALTGLAAPRPLPPRASPGLRDLVHARLARSPAALVAVQLEDILLIEEAQNLPGTIDEHPNWRRRYPVTVEQIADSQDLEKTSSIMADAGRGPKATKDTT